MKIAQLSPLWESVPPKAYGGTELVVSILSEGLANAGHEVTLFAAGDSQLSGHKNIRLIPTVEKSLRAMNFSNGTAILSELRVLERVIAQSGEFDIIHNHMGCQMLPFGTFSKTPIVTTLHGDLQSSLKEMYEYYAHMPYVSISHSQRRPCPQLNYVRTVYHGIDVNRYIPCYSNEKRYLAFLGRISPEKGIHHAIRIARETGWQLKIGAKVDPQDQAFFCREIQPQIDGDRIIYLGEVNHSLKIALLRNAAAVLCPVTWPEPFGLVLIEAMACGTPVLALRNGSIPEIVRHGETGFIADSAEELTTFIPYIDQVDRRTCREHVLKNFTMSRMIQEYVDVYETLIYQKKMNQCRIAHPSPILNGNFHSGTNNYGFASANAEVFKTSKKQQPALDDLTDGMEHAFNPTG